MSARLARTGLSSVARRVNVCVVRRNMSAESTTSHGASHSAKSSDTPWIVGAALVFGPLFLYLVSPSGRKTTQAHTVHDDVRDFPAIKLKDLSHDHANPPAAEKEEAPVEIMKDDEGTEANVAPSIALAERADVPKAAESSEANAETIAAAKSEAVEETAAPTEEAGPSSEESSSDASGTFQKSGEDGPTNLNAPRDAAKKGTTPKEQADAKTSD